MQPGTEAISHVSTSGIQLVVHLHDCKKAVIHIQVLGAGPQSHTVL